MKVEILSKNGREVVKLNRRRAIRERCLNCSGWSFVDVKNCEFKNCSLYPYRSGMGNQDSMDRSKAIRAYCLWCCGGQTSEVAKCSAIDCSLYAYRRGTADRSVEVPLYIKNKHIDNVSEENNVKAI